MKYLAALLLVYSINTSEATMQYQAFDEEAWSCLATDRIENTCGLEVRKIRRW
jgi:hypothetical protein